jgi:hypothetical protein
MACEFRFRAVATLCFTGQNEEAALKSHDCEGRSVLIVIIMAPKIDLSESPNYVILVLS